MNDRTKASMTTAASQFAFMLRADEVPMGAMAQELRAHLTPDEARAFMQGMINTQPGVLTKYLVSVVYCDSNGDRETVSLSIEATSQYNAIIQARAHVMDTDSGATKLSMHAMEDYA